MNIFIGWSGDNSKRFAEVMKVALAAIFPISQLEVFMSAKDIEAGDSWFETIKTQLTETSCAIFCCTPDNLDAVWINFEAGANMSNVIIPYLIEMKEIPKDNPLSNYEYITHCTAGFQKMVLNLNKKFQLSEKNNEELRAIAKKVFKQKFTNRTSIQKIKKYYKENQVITNNDIYPSNVKTQKLKSAYLSSPMSSLKYEEYKEFRTKMLKIVNILKNKCKVNAHYPGEMIEDASKFDGRRKVLKASLTGIKNSEYLIVVYPNAFPSSVLTEIGYAIALSKKIYIFAKRSNLPYSLQRADSIMNNVHINEYDNVDDIIKALEVEGEQFLN